MRIHRAPSKHVRPAFGTLGRTALAIAASAGVGFSACGGGNTGPNPPLPPPPPSDPDVMAQVGAPASASTGETLRFTATIRNIGGAAAEGVAATLSLSATVAVSAVSGGGAAAGAEVTWDVGDLAAGASQSLTVDVEMPAVGPLEGTIRATSAGADRNPSNNDGSQANATARAIVGFDAIRSVTGESAGDQFGWLMESLGDVDGDGVDDFVTSAPAVGGGAGRVYAYSGATAAELHRFTGTVGDRLGTGLDLAGDVNGDGVPDIVAGGPGASGPGRAVVLSGADGSTLYDLAGENGGDQFGTAVGRLGDVNGDGRDDFLVTAPGVDGALTGGGRVYIYSGASGTVLRSVDGDRANGQFGSAVGGIGDITGDGVPDFGVGATGARGQVYAFSGADGSQLLVIPPDATGQALGQFWLNSPGDLDGDGVPEIFASDLLNNGAAQQGGRAYAFSGADGSAVRVFDAEAGGDNFGIGRGIPDVDGDGVGDFIIAAWLNDEGGDGAGKIYVYSGGDGALIRTFSSLTAGENLGFDAVAIGDVNGDGTRDYLVSGGLTATAPGTVYVVGGIP